LTLGDGKQSTKSRQHEPIVITKRWDSASPQLFQALVSNQPLKSVLVFVRTRADGQEAVYYKITLQDALVVGIKQQGSAEFSSLKLCGLYT